jgi:hypothetical protein
MLSFRIICSSAFSIVRTFNSTCFQLRVFALSRKDLPSITPRIHLGQQAAVAKTNHRDWGNLPYAGYIRKDP